MLIVCLFVMLMQILGYFKVGEHVHSYIRILLEDFVLELYICLWKVVQVGYVPCNVASKNLVYGDFRERVFFRVSEFNKGLWLLSPASDNVIVPQCYDVEKLLVKCDIGQCFLIILKMQPCESILRVWDIGIIPLLELVKKGNKVGSCKAAVMPNLSMIMCFNFLLVQSVYCNGSIFRSVVLELVEHSSVAKCANAVANTVMMFTIPAMCPPRGNLKEEIGENALRDILMEYYLDQMVDLLKDGCSIKGKNQLYYCVFSHLKLDLFSLGMCKSICVEDGDLSLDDMKIQHWREENEMMADGRELLQLMACFVTKGLDTPPSHAAFLVLKKSVSSYRLLLSLRS